MPHTFLKLKTVYYQQLNVSNSKVRFMWLPYGQYFHQVWRSLIKLLSHVKSGNLGHSAVDLLIKKLHCQ